MTLTGTLRTWHDDRGFGFIAPAGGGRELFVHISAFPNDGSRPTEGESLGYELGTGRDGNPAATRVYRQAFGRPASYPTTRRAPARVRAKPTPWLKWFLTLVVLGAISAFVGTELKSRFARQELARPAPLPSAAEPATTLPNPYRCDGRTHCSQMRSCAEATYFNSHCPDTKMDSDLDGIPCEQQWCSGELNR